MHPNTTLAANPAKEQTYECRHHRPTPSHHPRGTKRELRLTLNTHGKWVVREWFETRDGLRPGRGGIELSVKEVRAFYEAVETVQPKPETHRE